LQRGGDREKKKGNADFVHSSYSPVRGEGREKKGNLLMVTGSHVARAGGRGGKGRSQYSFYLDGFKGGNSLVQGSAEKKDKGRGTRFCS